MRPRPKFFFSEYMKTKSMKIWFLQSEKEMQGKAVCSIYQSETDKGQLTSEWNFGVIKSPKKPTKF